MGKKGGRPEKRNLKDVVMGVPSMGKDVLKSIPGVRKVFKKEGPVEQVQPEAPKEQVYPVFTPKKQEGPTNVEVIQNHVENIVKKLDERGSLDPQHITPGKIRAAAELADRIQTKHSDVPLEQILSQVIHEGKRNPFPQEGEVWRSMQIGVGSREVDSVLGVSPIVQRVLSGERGEGQTKSNERFILTKTKGIKIIESD